MSRVPRLAEVVLASSNAGKLVEFRAILETLPAEGAATLRLRSLGEFSPVEFPAEGDDYLANAIAKARAVTTQLGLAAIADDSGLEVEAPSPEWIRRKGFLIYFGVRLFSGIIPLL